MKSRIIKVLAIAIASIGFSVATLSPVFAGNCENVCNPDCDAAPSVREAAGCTTNPTEQGLPNTIIGIINGVIAAAGLIAVVFTLIGGIQYMTSTGDPGKIKKAKDTILYAAIGLAVCVLAFAIVNFVAMIINNSATPSNTNSNGTSLYILNPDSVKS